MPVVVVAAIVVVVSVPATGVGVVVETMTTPEDVAAVMVVAAAVKVVVSVAATGVGVEATMRLVVVVAAAAARMEVVGWHASHSQLLPRQRPQMDVCSVVLMVQYSKIGHALPVKHKVIRTHIVKNIIYNQQQEKQKWCKKWEGCLKAGSTVKWRTACRCRSHLKFLHHSTLKSSTAFPAHVRTQPHIRLLPHCIYGTFVA